jgi:hypothetical protein
MWLLTLPLLTWLLTWTPWIWLLTLPLLMWLLMSPLLTWLLTWTLWMWLLTLPLLMWLLMSPLLMWHLCKTQHWQQQQSSQCVLLPPLSLLQTVSWQRLWAQFLYLTLAPHQHQQQHSWHTMMSLPAAVLSHPCQVMSCQEGLELMHSRNSKP